MTSSATHPTDYTVRLDAFEGPLDLLLFLIRRAEVEITDIPIAEITRQYLGYLEQFRIGEGDAGGSSDSPEDGPALDFERAGEFLVMAATLVEIKSRMLAPPAAAAAGREQPGGGGGLPGAELEAKVREVDPRSELVRQLLEYKRFRDATEMLSRHREEHFARFPVAGAPLKARIEVLPPDGEPIGADTDGSPVDIEDTTLLDLAAAFARIIQTVDFSRVGEHRVVLDDTPIELHAEDILASLRAMAGEQSAVSVRGVAAAGACVRFESLFKGRSRPEAIGLFLAMLELVKQRRIRVVQEAVVDSPHAAILIELAPENDAQAGETVPEPAGSSEESRSEWNDGAGAPASAPNAPGSTSPSSAQD